MRAVFVGASSTTLMTARLLLRHGHEVIIVDRDLERITELSNTLDCGLIHGDGSTPAILRETNPEQTDFLFCLTGHDQTNIIASLVGKSLGFRRVVTNIENPEFDHICVELGLEDVIIPAQTIGRLLGGMFEGQDPLELSALIKDEARVFSFIVREADEGTVEELNLPDAARVICIYHEDKFSLPEIDSKLKAGDQVVVICYSRVLPTLHERWGAPGRKKIK